METLINNISINTKTRAVKPDSNFLGMSFENKVEKLVIKMTDFIDGLASIKVRKLNSEGVVKSYNIVLEKVEDSYELEVKSSLLDVNISHNIEMQLCIITAQSKVFKSEIWQMNVQNSIVTDKTIPEQYATWSEIISKKIAEIDERIDLINQFGDSIKAFNENVIEKTTEFNQNTQTKKEEYNDNASAKTTEFDNNVENKKSEFDKYVDEVIEKKELIPAGGTTGQALVKKSNKDGDVEWADVADEDLADRVKELESIVNQMPSVEAEGTDYKLDNTIDAPVLDVGVKGNTWQQTYTGKNLANIKKIKDTTIIKIIEDTIQISNNSSSIGYISTQITLQELCPSIKVGDNVILSFISNHPSATYSKIIYLAEAKKSITINSITSVTQEMLDSNVVLYGGQEEQSTFIREFMIRLASENEIYEPYVGGIASPNINYPQDIHNVSGEVVVENRTLNLFNYEKYSDLYTNYEYVEQVYKCKAIKLKPLTTYTCYFSSLVAQTEPVILINNQKQVNNIGFLDIRKQNGKRTYTTDETGNLYIGMLYGNNEILAKRLKEINLMIVEGTLEIPYTPYIVNSATFPLEEGQYLAEGDYLDDDGIHQTKGRIRLPADGWEVHPLTKDNEYYYWIQGKRFSDYFINCGSYINNEFSDKVFLKCTHLIPLVREKINSPSKCALHNWANVGWFFVSSASPTLNEFKNWLQLNEVFLEYTLQTPQIIPYTPAQIEAYNDLKKLRSYSGGTYVVTSSDDLAPVAKEKALVEVAKASDINEIKQAVVALGGIL